MLGYGQTVRDFTNNKGCHKSARREEKKDVNRYNIEGSCSRDL